MRWNNVILKSFKEKMKKTISYRKYALVAFLLFLPTIGGAQIVHSLSALPYEAGEQALLRFEISQDTLISSTARFAIIFSEHFDLKPVMFADSRIMDGDIYVSVKKDTVWVKRGGNGSSIEANVKIDIIIALVKLPLDLELEYPFKILTEDISNSKISEFNLKLKPIQNN